MYKRILLVADCNKQTMVALREGALIAKAFAAQVHLLIVDRAAAGWVTADGVSLLHQPSNGPALLQLGLNRLSRLGVQAVGEILKGELAHLTCQTARQMKADLIIIGRQQQNFLARWSSGYFDSATIGNVGCSVMIAHESISDSEFEKHFENGIPLSV